MGNSAVPGVPTSRRSLAYEAIWALSAQPGVARFALVRALDQLTTEQILGLLDEVSETVDG